MSIEMILSTIWDMVKIILDILIVIYTILKNLKNNVKLSLLFKGILFIAIIKITSYLIILMKK